MRYIYTCIEQLDLAARQLADSNTASYGRFALILTDNIVELLLHRFCTDAVSRDQRSFNRTPAFTVKERAELVGRHFDPKAKHCAREAAISQAELEFIRIAHSFRNEAYHTGLVHDAIIWDVAWAYHDLACLLFGRWPINSWTTASEKVSDAVVRHFGNDNPYMRDATRRERPAASLAALKPRATRTLSEALSSALTARVDATIDSLQFLVSEDRHHRNEAAVVFDVQFYAYINSDESPVLGLRTEATFHEYHRVVEELQRSWRPKYPTSPLPRFRDRAVKIARDADPSKALVKYEGLVKEMESFETMVTDAAREADWAIQQAIDEARGR